MLHLVRDAQPAADVSVILEDLCRTDLLRNTTRAIRHDPLEAPTPQTVAPWPEVVAFLHHLEALAAPTKAAKTARQKAAQG